jgi:phosphoribosylpyrophosphate synthetase
MILGATYIHGHCIARRAGGLWQAVTFVPSRSRPGPEHPVVQLAQSVAEYQGVDARRILLATGPSNHADKRLALADRFAVSDEYRRYVRGRHVLVIDDTWVTGGSAQSAALTLKAAGASAVTILCVARWLNHTFTAEHAAIVESNVVPYDAMCCPVTGGHCPL